MSKRAQSWTLKCLLIRLSALSPSAFAFRFPARHRHVVAVDHFVVRAMPQRGGDLFGLQAFDPQHVVGGIVRQAAGEFRAGWHREAKRRLPLRNVPWRIDHADRQQAFALPFDAPRARRRRAPACRAAGR